MMIASFSHTEFYREFLMGRGNFDPRDFGVDKDRDLFTDEIVEHFNATFRQTWTIDELLLHPREAANFCDEVRRRYHYFDVPDDIILRSILTRRKNPNA
jgi:hypothetical protein